MLEVGGLRLDLLARRVWRGERAIDLSNREFALLEYFVRHPDQVLSRSQILFAVWEYDYEPGSNIVDVYVRYLRRKLRPTASRHRSSPCAAQATASTPASASQPSDSAGLVAAAVVGRWTGVGARGDGVRGGGSGEVGTAVGAGAGPMISRPGSPSVR